MKTKFLLILIACSANIFALEHDKMANSKIEQVTVYLNGAQITRSTSVNLSDGVNHVYLSGVSGKISKASIQPQIIGGARLLAIDYYSVIESSGRKDAMLIGKYNDSILIAEKELRRLEYIESAYLAEIKMFESNYSIGEKTAAGHVAEVQKMSNVISTRLLEVNKQLFNINENKDAERKKVARFHKEIEFLGKAERTQTYYVIKLSVISSAAGTSTIKVKYLVEGAAWTPKYSFAVEDLHSKIAMDYNAGVINQTGEDWIDIPLTLSTRDPNQGNVLASLTPWTINRRTRKTNEGNLDTYGSKRIGETQMKGASFDTIEIKEDVDFRITERYDIPSGMKPYIISIQQNKLKANFEYFAVPKLDKDAFLYAQVTGWDQLNLLQGPANVYFQGRYMGESEITPQYANDTLDIALSRDNRIFINRIKLEDKSERKLLGIDNYEKLTYRITVRNTNQVAVMMNVEDQVPVSTDESVKVQVNEISKASYDETSGLLKWRFNLNPGESKEFIVSFSVQYPKDRGYDFFNAGISNRRTRTKF